VLDAYLESISLIERLHRQFLDVVKAELDLIGVQDINNVQALILFNVGDDEITVGELTQRGYYLGSNVSYNLKKMVEADYLEQQRSPHDKRSIRIRLSPRGRELWAHMNRMFVRQIGELDADSLPASALAETNECLLALERFWFDAMGRALRADLRAASARFGAGSEPRALL